MPQNHLGLGPLGQHLDHLVATHPRIMVPRQPPLRDRALPVLAHVVHVRSEDPRPALREVDLQDAQTRRVPGGVVDVETGCELQEGACEGLPVEVEAEVVGQVDA